MDKSTTIEEIKTIIKQFCDEKNWDQYHNAKDLAIGVSTEANELLDIFRFKNEKQIEQYFRDEKKRLEITEEMSDVLYFLLRLAQKYDIDMATEFNKKMIKNGIKYPVELCKSKNKSYKEY